MSKKKNFEIKAVIEMVGDCEDCTAEDYRNLCELEECGYEIVRWVENVYRDEALGAWILEKKEYEVDRNIHDGLFIRLSDRVCEMLDRFSEGKGINGKNDENVKDKVLELMYRLSDGLDKWDCVDVVWCLDEMKEIFENEKRKRGLC